MANRSWVCILFSAVALGALLSSQQVLESAGKLYTHPGRVVTETGEPASVDITVWAESNKTGDQGCPQYGKQPLYITTPDAKQGDFVLSVPSTAPTYTVTYCASNVFSKTALQLNETDGTTVVPMPETVHRRGLTAKKYDDEVKRKTLEFLNNMTYLQQIYPGRFTETMGSLESLIMKTSKTKADVIAQIPGLLESWRR